MSLTAVSLPMRGGLKVNLKLTMIISGKCDDSNERFLRDSISGWIKPIKSPLSLLKG